MKLFVGLGNPGAKYEKTRHNIGFMAVDAIARAHNFSPERAKFQASASEGKLGTEKVFLIKPQTFMNLSGQSVGEALRFFKLEPTDVVVFHDELDLAPGKCRVKHGGGHAGHNGLRSCHAHLGPHYSRVRLGIGHPGDKNKVSGYVLHEFAKADWDWIDRLMTGIAEAAPALAAEDDAGFMNRVALRAAPPKASADRAAPSKSPDRPEAKADPSSAAPSSAEPSAAETSESSASPLQRLAARFRKPQ